MRVSPPELAAWIEGELVSGRPDRRVDTRASIDSRTLEPGQIFFAIVGDTHDGHAYVAQALARGASGVVVSKDVAHESAAPTRTAAGASKASAADPAGSSGAGFAIRVKDTTLALQMLASAVRERAALRVVAVTGSMGKTTTKDAAAAALSAAHVVLKSEGNLNNHWGLPLSLLRLRDESVAVLEMGMSAPGEISRLCEIARPDVGVVTNVAEAHLEFFGTVERIAEAKGELFFGLGPEGIAVVNADDPLVLRQAEAAGRNMILFGLDSKRSELRASAIETRADGLSFTAVKSDERAEVRSRLVGRHNVYNLLAGLAAASALDVPLAEAARALEGVAPGRHRGERIAIAEGVVLIDESYNANPRALGASLEMLADEPATRRVAVVGDMLELGERAEELHRAAGRKAVACGVDVLVAVGALAEAVAEGARAGGLNERGIHVVDDAEAAASLLEGLVTPGDVVLLKGSRGVGLDRVVARLEAFYGAGGANEGPTAGGSGSGSGGGGLGGLAR